MPFRTGWKSLEELRAIALAMRAETTNQHCSKGSIYFALEMREGWLSAHGIKAGAKVTNLPTP